MRRNKLSTDVFYTFISSKPIKMFTSLINLFYPKVCAGCDAMLSTGENVICIVCRHNIPLTNHHLLAENDAFIKFYGRIPIESASAMMYFQKKGIVQHLIHKLKYKGHQDIGKAIGQWYAEDLHNDPTWETVDQVIPVPLHPKRMRQRGYNQVTTFAKALANRLDRPLNDRLLIRNLYSKTQTTKNLMGRAQLDKEIFSAQFSDVDHNQHFLLVDDVLTTGATLEACGRALLKIPGAKITIACMAMSHS